ncbi:MAG: DedA family protein [Candidatus Dasytiphilus stammeri]
MLLGINILHINIKSLISQYGYWAIFFGCLIEGETIILLGGIAAQKKLLNYIFVILIAILGATLGDQLLFLVGYYYSNSKIFNKLKNNKQIIRLKDIIYKYPIMFIIGVRFMYGFRITGPIIIGASKLPKLQFFIFNLLGSVLWSLFFVTLGYLGGEMILPFLENFNRDMKYLISLLIFFIVIWIIRQLIWKQ